MQKTTAERPPERSSDEADARQLRLARRQGDALWTAIEEMKHETGGHFGYTRSGEYLVGYAVEDAEGLYEYEGEDRLVWREPERENAHVEIVVCDGADRRFVPGLEVTVTVVDPDGKIVGTHEQPYLWHPWLYHYGRNWELPADGAYSLRVRIAPPRYSRHDKKNGQRFTKTVDVEFAQVEIKRGRKRS